MAGSAEDSSGGAGRGAASSEGSPPVERLADDHFRCDAKVINEMGLHARPASLLVELAAKYGCDVRIRKGNEVKDAKSILQLLSLSAEMGTTLQLETKGADARVAIVALSNLFASGFNELESSET